MKTGSRTDAKRPERFKRLGPRAWTPSTMRRDESLRRMGGRRAILRGCHLDDDGKGAGVVAVRGHDPKRERLRPPIKHGERDVRGREGESRRSERDALDRARRRVERGGVVAEGPRRGEGGASRDRLPLPGGRGPAVRGPRDADVLGRDVNRVRSQNVYGPTESHDEDNNNDDDNDEGRPRLPGWHRRRQDGVLRRLRRRTRLPRPTGA